MFILVSGELAVKNGDVELSRIRPVDVVGEMGVITGMPRSATIEVAEDATLIAIRKMVFDLLIKKDIDLAGKVYKNVFESLCRKLEENKDQLVKGFSAGDGQTAAPETEAYPQELKAALQDASGKGAVDGRTKVKELIQLRRRAPRTARAARSTRRPRHPVRQGVRRTPATPTARRRDNGRIPYEREPF